MRERNSFYKKYGKRMLDILLSGGALLVLWPVLTVVAILVRTKLGSPVIFCQERPGRDEKIFRLYKFRSMTDARDENGELMSDEVRLTKFGRLLRSTSLDELPELWNIFRGDMSIVGPRPLLVKYLPLYNDEQRRRHHVTPGLTGWAQVNGRNAITWEEKFALDVKIVWATAKAVLRREGISAENSVTMEAFTGTRQSTEEQEMLHCGCSGKEGNK